MKKLAFFLFVLAIAFPICASGAPLLGDVDGDGEVAIADVSALVDYLMTNDASQIVLENANVDGDGEVAISDVSALIDILLNGPQTPEPTEEYVDLGLPSHTEWATHNVGATNPEDYGDYFAWGETEPKDNYDWDNYKWVNASTGSLYFTKYCMKSTEGDVDSKDQLDLEDDAAYVNWGPEWRMPTRDQIYELMDNCTAEWTQMNGVNGELITGPNGKTIFFPAAGYWGDKLFLAGEGGFYWGCSMLFVPPTHYYSQHGTSIHFDVEWWEWNSGSRCAGFTVRPVRASQN